MLSSNRNVPKGSWSWTLYVAEMVAWGTLAVLVLVLAGSDLTGEQFAGGAALIVALVASLLVFFRVLVARHRNSRWLAPAAFTGGLAFATVFYALVNEVVPSAQLVFVPVVAVLGLLTGIREGIVAAALTTATFVSTAALTGGTPRLVAVAVNGGIYLLTGAVSGLLAAEMRSHFAGEREEQRLATAVRHRLLAVLDAVDEAIVFRDRHGTARVVNRRAGDIFGIDPDEFLGGPVVELLRTVARKVEDPEEFMETFQDLRDDPARELRVQIEQIIPARRQLRLFSAATFDDAGELVGRIDVYTDVTEAARRAAEVERLYEQARRTAESYQRSLLPQSVPTLPRTGLVAHYVPAAGRREVCGDFYDFVPLRDGRVGLVLGDVCGIGPEAANDAALTRYTLRTFGAEAEDVAEVMDRLNDHLHKNMPADRFARVFIGALDPERARFEYVSAGHVPPVVYRAKEGDVEWLQEGGMVLGVEEGVTYKAGEVRLDPGDTIVLYTDGVTEAPRNGRPFGQGKFSDLIKEYGAGTPGEVIQAVRRSVEAWSEGNALRDDLALVVCRVVPDETADEPTRELVLPNDASRIAEVRRFVTAFLVDARCPIDVSQEIVLAVNEAAANACRYGRRTGGGSEMRLHCAKTGGRLRVTVADDGPGFDTGARAAALPDRYASGGRGLYLMRTLTDELEIDSTPWGTRVTLVRAFDDPPLDGEGYDT